MEWIMHARFKWPQMFRNKIGKTMHNNIAYAFLFEYFTFAICTLAHIRHSLAARAHVKINNQFNVWHVRHSNRITMQRANALWREIVHSTLNDSLSATGRTIYISNWHTLSIVVLIKIQFKLKCDNTIIVYRAFANVEMVDYRIWTCRGAASLLASCADFSLARRSMSPHKRASHNHRWSALTLIRTQRQHITFNITVCCVRFVTKEKQSIQLNTARPIDNGTNEQKPNAEGRK